MTDIREYLKNHVLLFDGGMGTYYAELSHTAGTDCEQANLKEPELIRNIHREYLEAGCRAIKTNTFSVNRPNLGGDGAAAEQLIRAGYQLASEEAAKSDAYVFADIGPVTIAEDMGSSAEEYKFLADLFISCGAKYFLFETMPNADGLPEAAAHIHAQVPDAFIIVSFAVMAEGYSRDGMFVSELFDRICASENVDAVGLNCVCGARHMLELIRGADHGDKLLSVMPNAGYPTVVSNRTFYEGDPVYFASQVAELAAAGASIVGGCCGTTPVHTKKIREALDKGAAKILPGAQTAGMLKSDDISGESRFWQKLSSGKKVIAVELDPPPDINMNKFMSGAWQLKDAGVDIITIADCPIARACMDSSILACKLRRELGIDALPHMTCRDRNLNATKALLLGLYSEGIRNVLLVTGDPVPTAERDEVKMVYQFNSRKLAAFVSSLNKKMLQSPFHIFGALNVNAINFDVQLRIAKEKIEKGMKGFLTQPVLSPEAVENLKRASEELDAYILGGIMPVVSERNARFMNSEINGIRLSPAIIDRYVGKNRAEGEALATEISVQIMQEIAQYVDGFYLMTPFGRTGRITAIIKEYAAAASRGEK